MQPFPPRRLAAHALPALVSVGVGAGLLGLWPAGPTQAQDGATRAEITGRPAIVSSPASGDTYGAGETIRVAPTFNQPVTVTGKPRLRLTTGDNVRRSVHDGSDENGATLFFAYTVNPADRDDHGIGIRKNQLQLNDSSITDGGVNATSLDHTALS